MNKTFTSLLSKGINSRIAKNVVDSGYNLSTLSSCSKTTLDQLGINEALKHLIFNSKRPPIPKKIINNLLHKSRRTCCICRNNERSIIIHHIDEWSDSKSNEENNLVVLCLIHHNEAHTKREFTQNLTSEKIRASKEIWEKKVNELDKLILEKDFKELEVITQKASLLKEKWFNFLKNIGMNIDLINESFDKLKFDFNIYGKSHLLAKVYDIERIDDLINKENLIQKLKGTSFLDGLIILGSKPFLSNNGFYSNEQNIQIGWIYSYGVGNWDSVMLKENFDISNGIFFVENLLYEKTNYKNFLTDENFDEVMKIWNK
ncbi:HNH endonuclease [Tenacibaculum dicentrarchi]|nr:HNH endonuclease [Tenacibaculum dicentrarchi]